jgi:hypothetical protein
VFVKPAQEFLTRKALDMPIVASHPSQEESPQRSNRRDVVAAALGIAALVAFILLAAPTDLLLFDFAGVPLFGAISQTLYPLALGPEILFSPVSLLLAIAAIVVGDRHTLVAPGAHGSSVAPGAHGSSVTLARAGTLLGWVVVALYALSLGLFVLSFLGIMKPLI